MNKEQRKARAWGLFVDHPGYCRARRSRKLHCAMCAAPRAQLHACCTSPAGGGNLCWGPAWNSSTGRGRLRLANAQTRVRYAHAGAQYAHTGRTCSASNRAKAPDVSLSLPPPNVGAYTRTPSHYHPCSAVGAQIFSLRSHDLVVPKLPACGFFFLINSCLFFCLFEAATQLARQVHQECTQVVCSNKVDRSRLAFWHSRY